VVLSVDTHGNIHLGSTNSTDNFTPVSYTPSYFLVNVNKNQKPIYYTTVNPGACQTPIELWNDPVLGCKCNGTFVEGTTRNITIPLSSCDSCNSTPPSVRNFFLEERTAYGTMRYTENPPSGIPLLEITKVAYDSNTGYAYRVPDILFSFQKTQGCSDSSGYQLPIALGMQFLVLISLLL